MAVQAAILRDASHRLKGEGLLLRTMPESPETIGFIERVRFLFPRDVAQCSHNIRPSYRIRPDDRRRYSWMGDFHGDLRCLVLPSRACVQPSPCRCDCAVGGESCKPHHARNHPRVRPRSGTGSRHRCLYPGPVGARRQGARSHPDRVWVGFRQTASDRASRGRACSGWTRPGWRPTTCSRRRLARW